MITISIGETNALGYELYSAVAEINGQGIPVAFIFTTSDGTADEGAKERMLQDLLKYVKTHCPNITFTLSDKDLSEINAFRAQLPHAKHQLCYWHAIRYIEERLRENRPLAAYDPRKAHEAFDFIDPTWAPGITSGLLEDGMHPDDAPEEIKEVLKIRIQLQISDKDKAYHGGPLNPQGNKEKPAESINTSEKVNYIGAIYSQS